MPSDKERGEDRTKESRGDERSRRADEVVAELESQMKREEATAAPAAADAETGQLPDAATPFQQIAAHLAAGWRPPVMPRRSKREEAEAFFAFTQRLAQRMAEEAAAPPEEAAAPESVSPPEEPKEQVEEESTPE